MGLVVALGLVLRLVDSVGAYTGPRSASEFYHPVGSGALGVALEPVLRLEGLVVGCTVLGSTSPKFDVW